VKVPLKYKITLIFGFIFVVTFIGIYFYLDVNLTSHTFTRTRNTLTNQIHLARSYLKTAHEKGMGIDAIDAIADKIASDLNLRVTIIDHEGKVWGDSQLDRKGLDTVENHLYRPEVQDALENGKGESRRFSTTLQQDMFYVAQPFNISYLKGVIRLSIPLVDLDIISDRLKNVLSVSLLFALLFAILISYFASIFISQPIRDVSQTARKIAEGDFSRKVAAHTRDEIGDLADAFNFMSDQIKDRIEEFMINKSRLEAVLLSMVEGVMAIDLNSEIILMNETLKDFLQVKEDVAGRRPIEVVRNIEIQEIVDKALESKSKVESYEVTILLPYERITLIHATSLVRDNNVEGVVLVFHDITELRKLENIRKDFVANVSHELRTPVTSIKGYAETLINGAIEDEQNALDFLKIIYKDSERLAKLVEDLLDLSKIESGKVNLDVSPQPLQPIIDRVLAGLSMQIRERMITVDVNLPKKLPKVLIDERAIAQVFLNLIENAIKYNRPSGKVIISAREHEEFIQVDVEDTGIGIPQEDIDRIFERFYRVDKAHSRELGGTGLGLSIVKHMINLHKGEVFAQSKPDEGSIFSFTIPKA
jgi:two-component system phosphate regulon sensor histidine kinase PhoR